MGNTNDAPIVSNQDVELDANSSIVITLQASDVDGDSLTYNIVSEPQHGSFSGYAPALTYTPQEDYSGTDSFTYTANDGEIDSEVATVSITVTAVNLAPLAQGQELTVEMDQVLALVLLATDTDSEVESLTYQIASQPQYGTLSGTAPDLTYTPEAGYSGTDSFTFSVNDGELDSEVATVSITVTAVNLAPIAQGQELTVEMDQVLALVLTATDADSEAESLTYTYTPPQ